MSENNEKEKTEVVSSDDNKGITLNDLILLKQIVNLASRRGAFSAEEFKDIGDVYNRLDGFITTQMKVLEDSKEKDENKETDDNKQVTI